MYFFQRLFIPYINALELLWVKFVFIIIFFLHFFFERIYYLKTKEIVYLVSFLGI